MFAKLVLLCSVPLFLVGHSTASDLATLTGTVTDVSGAVVSGAFVNLHQVAGAALLTAVSDTSGRFTFPKVSPGEYLLDASARGLTITQPETLTFSAGEAKEISVQLVVSAVSTQVSVTAASQPQSVDEVSKALDIVNVSEAERRGFFSIPEAVRFMPGLRVSARGSPGAFTTIQTRGLRVTDTGILIDGFPFRDVTSIQDEASAFIGDLLLVNSSRIEVLRGSGSSLYGSNSMSGTVNIITDPGGGSTHADVDVQGGGLGLFRGVANLGGSALSNRLAYSAGISHLNVTEGVDDFEAARDWSGQGAVTYALTSNTRLGADLFANTGYLQDPVSPAATPGINATGIIPAIPLPFDQMQRVAANLPYEPGNSTFLPSLGDPDSGIYSHFAFALFRFEHEVNSRLSYRAAYEYVDTHRNNTNGPAGPNTPDNFEPTFNTAELYNGRLDVARGRLDYLLGAHQLITAGYEFQREHYLNVNSDQNPDLTQRLYNSTEATQRSHAAFAQDQIGFLSNRLEILLSGRFTHISVDHPKFVGSASPYENFTMPSSSSGYT
jgi:vitamin B12 transporter